MQRLTDVLRQSLLSEAERAPSPAGAIHRVLSHHPAPAEHSRSRLRSLGVAMAVALVSYFILTSQNNDHGHHRQREHVASSAISTVDHSSRSRQPSRLPGYLVLDRNGVDISLVVRASSGAGWWTTWVVPCPKSVLASLERRAASEAACTSRDSTDPTWEVLMAPGPSPSPLRSPLFQVLPGAVVRHSADDLPPSTGSTVAGTAAVLTNTTGLIRNSCGRNCHRWTVRFFSAVYFAVRHMHISMLAPTRSDIRWLRDYIYLT